MLEAVSTLLEDEFSVVAAVTDGRQAIDAVGRLDPDIAVLDITMPELDGFRTAQAMKKAGSRSKVVFLTLHDADEYVEAALRTGAQGYVLKSRMEADLPSALHHALAGRSFLPSLTSLSMLAGSAGGHCVHFRANGSSSHDSVVEMLLSAIAYRDMAVVVGTPDLRAGIARGLTAGGCDLTALRGKGGYFEFDAAEALSEFMRNGLPDRVELEKMVDNIERLRRARQTGGRGRVTIFGEMAGLLIQHGHFEAALRLEQMWSELTRTLPYFTICSYLAPTLRASQYPDAWAAVCAEHSAVCHAARLQ
jgi:DNA-binding NarL/FixJ family response regulator